MDENQEPENPVRFFDIERMTPEQRMSRFTDLLAMASVRLIHQQISAKEGVIRATGLSNELDGL